MVIEEDAAQLELQAVSVLITHCSFTAEILGPEEDLTCVVIEEDAAQLELQAALNKTRRLKQKKARSAAEKLAEDLVLQRNVAAMEAEEAAPVGIELPGSSIVLNSTSEFCRALGDIPTYGQAGNREEEKDELLVCLHMVSVISGLVVRIWSATYTL